MPSRLVMQNTALSVGFMFWKLFPYDERDPKQGERGAGLQAACWVGAWFSRAF